MTTSDTPIFDLVIHNVNLATMNEESHYGVIKNALVAIKDGIIVKIIENADQHAGELKTQRAIDAKNGWMTPGLIDCHTHLVYAGNRADEFEMRLEGKSYQQIAESGGGILSTVNATRKASADELFNLSAKRLSYLIDEGITTLEVKSGYGLDLTSEEKMLKVAQELDACAPVEISKTFLGAHAVPPEYKNNADGYIDLICQQMMPRFAELGLIDCVDAFCEGIGFNLAQTRRVFETAVSLGLPVKLHAEQLSNLGGSALASEFNAWSVDHLEFLSQQDVIKLKQSNTVATLLPGAFYFLGETQLPPIDALRQHKVPIAIASDSNPGSSPCLSLLLMLNMATTLFKLTPFEALKGVTLNAARALRKEHKIGSIEPGKQADLVIWDIQSPAELSYRIGGNPCVCVVKKGEVVVSKLASKD